MTKMFWQKIPFFTGSRKEQTSRAGKHLFRLARMLDISSLVDVKYTVHPIFPNGVYCL